MLHKDDVVSPPETHARLRVSETLTGWWLWWWINPSRAFSCDSGWTTSASGTSSRHSCRNSDSTLRRTQPWAWERCRGCRWLHIPGIQFGRPQPENRKHTHNKQQRYPFQGYDGRTTVELYGLLGHQIQWCQTSSSDSGFMLFCWHLSSE